MGRVVRREEEGKRGAPRAGEQRKKQTSLCSFFPYLFHRHALARDLVSRRGDDPVRALADGLKVGVRRERKRAWEEMRAWRRREAINGYHSASTRFFRFPSYFLFYQTHLDRRVPRVEHEARPPELPGLASGRDGALERAGGRGRGRRGRGSRRLGGGGTGCCVAAALCCCFAHLNCVFLSFVELGERASICYFLFVRRVERALALASAYH